MVQLIKGVVDTQKNSYRSIGQVSAGDDLELELEVKMNGQPIEFINPECELLIKKSDNNKVRQTKDIIYQDGKFKIKVDEQGVTYPGIVTCQLVTKEDGRVSTCLFYFMVGASLDREILQSISKVEVLEQLDEYIAIAFANLEEYEKRILSSDETIRKLNDDMNEAEKIRGASELERQETFKDLKENMNATISNLESSINLSNLNEKERSEVFNSLKSDLESIKQDLNTLNTNITLEEGKRVQAEINRVNKALEIIEKLESTNNSVATAEAERVTVFNDIKSELTSLKEALTTINNTANSNEEVRKENEVGRVAAEQQRQDNFNSMKLENDNFKKGINEQYEEIHSMTKQVVSVYKSDNISTTLPYIKDTAGASGWLYDMFAIEEKTWKNYKYVFIALELSFSSVLDGMATNSISVLAKGTTSQTISQSSERISPVVNIVSGEKYIIQYRVVIDENKTTEFPNANNLFIQYGNTSKIGNPSITISNIFIKSSSLSDVSDVKDEFNKFGFTSVYNKLIDYNDIPTINKPRIDGVLLTKDTSFNDFEKPIESIVNKKMNSIENLIYSNKATHFDISTLTMGGNDVDCVRTVNSDGSVSFNLSNNTTDTRGWAYTNNILIPNYEWIEGHTYLLSIRAKFNEIIDNVAGSASGNFGISALQITNAPNKTTPICEPSIKTNIGTIGAITDFMSICTVNSRINETTVKNAMIMQLNVIQPNVVVGFTVYDICVVDATELGLTESEVIDKFNIYGFTKEEIKDSVFDINVSSSTNSNYAEKAGSVDEIKISTDIEIWGDSLVGQGYGKYIGEILGRNVLTKGYGGKTSTYIRDMFLKDANLNKTQIINVGRNNYQEPDVVIQDIRRMVDAIPHNNFLICCPPNGNYGEGIGTTAYKNFQTIEEKLRRRYQANFLNTRECTIEEYHMGNVELIKSFVQPQVGSSITINVSNASFLTSYNSNDLNKWGEEFMKKIVIGKSIESVDIYRVDSYDIENNTLTITLLENNSGVKPGSTVGNWTDNGGLNSVKYLRVLQYADYYCYTIDTTQSTFRSDGIHMTTEGQKCIAKVVARKINTMKI